MGSGDNSEFTGGSWRSYVIRIGDRCAEYGDQTEAEEHIDTCSMVLARDLSHYEDDILDVLMQCIEELPHKHPLYGSLVGLVNLDETDFVAKLLNRVHDRLQDALDTDNCNRLRILLRFLAVLMCSNVLSSTSLVEVFEILLSSAATTVDEDGGNPAWQPRADFYVFCILASLPWCGLELSERAPEELERVMAAVEAYFSLRMCKPDSSLCPFNVDADGDVTMTGQDLTQDLWSRIQHLQQAGWKAESVLRPHLSFEARLATSQSSHQFGSVTCPEAPKPYPGSKDVAFGRQWQEAELKYPQRTGRLRAFPSEKTEKDMTPIDRFVVEEYLLDVLFYLNGCRKECAAYMVQLPVPFRYEYLMAETILGQMLLLPKPPFRLIYYTIVIVDLCKALPGAFPPVVAEAVRALFNKMGELDVECQFRLIQWLSHHLSNFQFVWPWEGWVDVVEQPAWSPQRVFTQEVLEKEVRLSYWERVKQSLDSFPKLCDLLPPKNTPCFKYSKEKQAEGSEVEAALSNDLNGQIKAKKTVKEIQSWFEAKVIPASGQKVVIEILLQTLLNMGSKSFTHMVTVLERYGQLIAKVASDQSLQVCVVEEVSNFWQNSSQMTAIVVDRMMGYRLISNLAIVKWAFLEANVQTFHTSGRIWEVLQNAISKTINRTADLQKDIENAKKALDEANAAADKAEANRVNVQSLIDSAETEDARRQATNRMEWVKTTIEKARDRQSSAQDLLETKEALLARALKEQETLFLSVFQKFASVVTEKMSKSEGTGGPDIEDNAMEVDMEDATGNEADAEGDNDRRNERFRNNEAGKTGGLKEEESKQWQRCTLGYLQAISRLYSVEVWQIIGRLDAEVFTQNVHPSVSKAVYRGIRRQT